MGKVDTKDAPFAKVGVVSSNLIARSNYTYGEDVDFKGPYGPFCCFWVLARSAQVGVCGSNRVAYRPISLVTEINLSDIGS